MSANLFLLPLLVGLQTFKAFCMVLCLTVLTMGSSSRGSLYSLKLGNLLDMVLKSYEPAVLAVSRRAAFTSHSERR